MDDINWRTFDQWPRPRVRCRCGHWYRSHAKGIRTDDGAFGIASERPCPSCGASGIGHIQQVSHDPEIQIIGPSDDTCTPT